MPQPVTPYAISEITEIAAKFRGAIDFQEQERGLIERRTQLHVVACALIARVHVILHGEPGVAKSMTVDGLLMHLPSVSLFKTQAYKASPPEQFLGPISLKQMAEDKFVRITARRLAAVKVAFIDELPRAPRALLPAFQGMMVEREFDSGDGAKHVPLMTLIGTSNHLPEDEELAAFFDRFALKLVVKRPSSQTAFVNIMRGALHRRAQGEPTVPDELLIADWELARIQSAADAVTIPDEVLDAMGELWANLLSLGINPSIRRNVDLTKVMQANAILNDRDEVTIDDLQVAQHSLWTSEDEISVVYGEVVKFASEYTKTKVGYLDAFTDTLDLLGKIQSAVAAGVDLSAELPGDGGKSVTDNSIRLVSDQRKLAALIIKHRQDAPNGIDHELDAALAQIAAAKAWVQERILGGLEI